MLVVKKNLLYLSYFFAFSWLSHTGSFCRTNRFTPSIHAKRKSKVLVRRTHIRTQSGQSHQIVRPLPQPVPLLLCTVILFSEPSSSESPSSPHSHFTPAELIRGGGYSSMPAEYTPVIARSGLPEPPIHPQNMNEFRNSPQWKRPSLS